MSILWIWFGIIFDVNIGLDHARARSGMIWCCAPSVIQQLHPAEFLEHYTAPVGRRAHGLKTAPAVATILVTDHSQLSVRIPAQSMRAKQAPPSLVDRFDWFPPLYRSPHQPVNLFNRLELSLNN
jgi:hypothetical protein